MSKYIKLEDAIHKIAEYDRDWEQYECETASELGYVVELKPLEEHIEGVSRLIADVPTIEIVHCKECKRKYVTGNTTQYYVCDFMDAQFDENGYCHHGERIEE